MTIGGELQLGFATQFALSYHDKGSGGSHNGAFYQPQPSEGFWPLGSLGVAVSNYDYNPNGVQAVIVAQDLSGSALAAPLGYDWVWDDSKSGADMDGSMWRPQAPLGYVAMGLVCNTGHGAPSVDAVRCVRKDLVVAATPGALVWDDSKTGASHDFGAWQVVAPEAAAGQLTLTPGTFCGAGSHNQQDVMKLPTTLYAFSVTLPEQPPTDEPAYPQLTSTHNPGPFGQGSGTAVTELPWFAVEDPSYGPLQRLLASPTYRLVRTDRWKLIEQGFYYNGGDDNQTASISWSEGVDGESATSFASATGIEFGAEYGFTALFKVNIKLSQSFTYTTSSSTGWNKSTTRTINFNVPPETAVAGYTMESGYNLYRQDGTQVNTDSAGYIVPATVVWAQYPHRNQVTEA
jgi:hypothetical protein